MDWLCRHRWPRELAAGVVYLGALALLIVALLLMVPHFVSPLQDLAGRLLAQLGTLDIPSLKARALQWIRAHAPPPLHGALNAAVQQGAAQLQALSKNLGNDLLVVARTVSSSTVAGTFDLAGRAMGALLSLLSILILSFLMMTLGRPFAQQVRSH